MAAAQQEAWQTLDLVGQGLTRATARSQPGMIASGYSAEDAKNSGIITSWPMPMKRSRSLTSDASALSDRGDLAGLDVQGTRSTAVSAPKRTTNPSVET